MKCLYERVTKCLMQEKKENLLKKKISEKWGKSVTLRGFSQIPYYLLHINRFLSEEKKLSSLELLIIIQLTSNWWDKKENPYPSMINIADRCNVSERQIQRAINKIEEKGFIKEKKCYLKVVLFREILMI